MDKDYKITSFDDKTDLVWFNEQGIAEDFINYLDIIEPTRKHILTKNICTQGNFYVKLPKEKSQQLINDFFVENTQPELTQETMEYFANKAAMKKEMQNEEVKEGKNVPNILKEEFKTLFCYVGYNVGDDVEVYIEEEKKWVDGKVVNINDSWNCKIGDAICVSKETPYFFLNFLVVINIQSNNPRTITIINSNYIKKKS